MSNEKLLTSLNDADGAVIPAAATRFVRLTALSTLLAVCLLALTLLGLEVIKELEKLKSVNRDNAQWNFSQVEVDFYKLRNELNDAANSNQPNLTKTRQAFDIFFNRFATMVNGPYSMALSQDSATKNNVERVTEFLQTSLAIVDASDDVFSQNLQTLVDASTKLSPDIRRIALAGLQIFITEAESSRTEISSTLLRLAILATTTIIVLILAVLLLIRLNIANDRRAIETRSINTRLSTVINSSLDAILIADHTGKVLQYNSAAQDIFGYTTQEMIGADLTEKIVPAKFRNAHAAGMNRAINGQETHRIIGSGRVKLEALHKNGHLFPIELALDVIKNDDETLYVAFIRDITLDVAAQEELVKARDRALAGEKAKADFLAVMSHEMRTPLNGIVGTLSLLQDTKLDENQRLCLDAMNMSAKQLEHHVNDVLDISRFEAGKTTLNKELVDIRSLISSLVESQMEMADRYGNSIDIDWTHGTPESVITDAQKFRQVMHNLLDNANKFTRSGVIRIEAERINTHKSGHTLEFRVFDTGIGIHAEFLDRIFNDFESLNSEYNRSTEGAGLGLSIARRMVQALNGKIGVESTQGEGSLFWIQIPVDHSDMSWTGDATADHTTTSTLTPLNVLMVEDNEINQFVLREMLENAGHIVDLAENGAKGVEMANATKYDVILMDISMPVMDGITATKEIRSGDGLSANSPVIAATANAMPEEIERFKSVGINDILRKPISKPSLVSKLTQLIENKAHLKFMGENVMSADLVDVERITYLKDELGVDVAKSLVARLDQEADKLLKDVKDPAIKTRDTGEVVAELHKFAGSCAALGLFGMQRQLNTMENMGKQGDTDRMFAEINTLINVWQSCRETLIEYEIL